MKNRLKITIYIGANTLIGENFLAVITTIQNKTESVWEPNVFECLARGLRIIQVSLCKSRRGYEQYFDRKQSNKSFNF